MTLTGNDPINIIYAEDDEEDRDLFAEALAKADVNANLVTVENGNDLIQHLAKNIPDIIFLDINMPILNGKDCLRAIRRHSRFKNIPIIIVSTSSFEKDIEEAYAGGANMYVVKPISFNSQIENFKKILSRNWQTELLKRDKKKFLLDHGQVDGEDKGGNNFF